MASDKEVLRQQHILHALHTGFVPLLGGVGAFGMVPDDDGTRHLFFDYVERPKTSRREPASRRFVGRLIGHAVTSDFRNWAEHEPAIRRKTSGEGYPTFPSVLRHGDHYVMLCAAVGQAGRTDLLRYRSTDLRHWRQNGKIKFKPGTRSQGKLTGTCLLEHAGEFLLYRCLAADGVVRVVLNTSSDLRRWSDAAEVCTIPANGEETPKASVCTDGGRFSLCYGVGGKLHCVTSRRPDGFDCSSSRLLGDGIREFRMVDAEQGLFAYTDHSAYPALRFGRLAGGKGNLRIWTPAAGQLGTGERYCADVANVSDATELARTDDAAFAPWYSTRPTTEEEIEKISVDYANKLNKGAYIAVVRDSTGKVVGLAEAGGSKGTSFSIGTVAVAPEHQGRRLGLLLLQEVELEARRRGLDIITLSTMNRYRGMVSTAVRFGFNVLDVHYDGSRGDHRLTMVKDLRLCGE